jgi:hypothetical protein
MMGSHCNVPILYHSVSHGTMVHVLVIPPYHTICPGGGDPAKIENQNVLHCRCLI